MEKFSKTYQFLSPRLTLDKHYSAFELMMIMYVNHVNNDDAVHDDVGDAFHDDDVHDDVDGVPGEEEGAEQAARNKLQISQGIRGQTSPGENIGGGAKSKSSREKLLAKAFQARVNFV